MKTEDLTHYQMQQWVRHQFWVKPFMPGGERFEEYKEQTEKVRAASGNPTFFVCKPPKKFGVFSQMCPQWDGEWLEIWRVHGGNAEVAVHLMVIRNWDTNEPTPFDNRLLRHLAYMDAAKTDPAEQERRYQAALADQQRKQEEGIDDKILTEGERIRYALEEDQKQKVSRTVAADLDSAPSKRKRAGAGQKQTRSEEGDPHSAIQDA